MLTIFDRSFSRLRQLVARRPLLHFHYADLRVTQNDVLFVKKEFRGGRLGLRLLKATEDHAKSEGCKLMLWHAKENTALDKLLPKLKYGVQEIMYSKEI